MNICSKNKIQADRLRAFIDAPVTPKSCKVDRLRLKTHKLTGLRAFVIKGFQVFKSCHKPVNLSTCQQSVNSKADRVKSLYYQGFSDFQNLSPDTLTGDRLRAFIDAPVTCQPPYSIYTSRLSAERVIY